MGNKKAADPLTAPRGKCKKCSTDICSATAELCVLCAGDALYLKVRRYTGSDQVTVWLMERGRNDVASESSILHGEMSAHRASDLVLRMKQLGIPAEEEAPVTPYVPVSTVNQQQELFK